MKQLTSFSTFVLLCSALFFQSCTLFRFAYSPTIQNVPGFKEKNESRLNTIIAAPASGTESNFSLQGAYAVTNHFALTAGMNVTVRSLDELTFTDINGNTQTDRVQYNRNSFEFGAGVFYPLSKDKSIFFEAYAGYGSGANNITDMTTISVTNFHNSKINRFYLQPVLSFHPLQYFTLSTSLRYTSIGYSNIKTSYTQNELASYNLEVIASKRLEFLEPVLVMSGGLPSAPWIRLQGQMNFSVLMNEINVYYRTNYFSFGFQLDPVKAFQKNKN